MYSSQDICYAIGYPTLYATQYFDDETGHYTKAVVFPRDAPKMCPLCGVANPKLRIKDNATRLVRHTKTTENKLLVLELHVRKFECKECGGYFWERVECCGPNDCITYKLAEELGVRAILTPFNQIKGQYQISVTRVREAFDAWCEAHKDDLEFVMPEYLGVDEAHLNKTFRFVVTDPASRLLLDIHYSNDKPALNEYFQRRSEQYHDLQNVKYIVIDMSQGYLNTLSKIFPTAKFIVDRYHVVQSMNDKLDKYRQEIRDAETDKTWNRTLFDVRNLLKMDYEDILIKSNAYRAGDKDAWEFHYDPKYKLEQLFKRYPNLEKAFDIKEAVRFLYRCTDRHDAAEHFLRLEAAVKAEATGMGTKLFVGAIRNLKRWMPYILNWIGAPMTNGFTESMNDKVKLVEKVGRGYSFDTLRYKALFGSRIKHYNPSKIDLKLSKWSPSTTMRDFTTFDLFAPEKEHITFLEANYQEAGYEFAPFPIDVPKELQRL